jgi:hypothetical protein
VSLLLSGYISSHWPNMRCATMIVGNLICVGAGGALVGLSPDQTWGRLVALWLCSCQSVGFAMSLTMISSNIAGYTKKQVSQIQQDNDGHILTANPYCARLLVLHCSWDVRRFAS